MGPLASNGFHYVPVAHLGNYSRVPFSVLALYRSVCIRYVPGRVFCLVTLDDECFHSCKQGTFAKKLGLLEKAADLIIYGV